MEIKNRFSVSARRMGRSIIRELLKLAEEYDMVIIEDVPYRRLAALIKEQV